MDGCDGVTAAGDRQVFALVCDAWRATLPHDAFDPDRSLGDAGADSLRVMAFVLRMEQALARPIALDLLHAGATARTIAVGIGGTPAPSAADGRTPLFFLPGIGGDEPVMAEFRRAFADRIAFTLIDHPGAEQPAALLEDLSATAGIVAERIAGLRPAGPIRLAGYSFGGTLAAEVARRLLVQGREVAFLWLLDVVPPRSPARRVLDMLGMPSTMWRRLVARLPRLRRHPGQGLARSVAFDAALRIGAYGVASRVARREVGVGALGDLSTADRFRLWHHRAQALKTWVPARIDLPALLVASDDGMAARAPAFWRRLIPDLVVVTVPGEHGALSTATSIARIAPVLDACLGADRAAG